MSEKDDKNKELERKRAQSMDEEIFGKTMGFVYAKDSSKFEDMKALDHAHAPGLNREEEDYQATVRFKSPEAMSQGLPPKPAAPQAAKPTPPQPAKPAPKPAAPQAAKPIPPQPAKPAPKPAVPQAAKPIPPQPAKPAPKPAAPQAAKPTPPQPGKPAPKPAAKPAEAEEILSLDDLDAFLLPDASAGIETPTPAAAPQAAAKTPAAPDSGLDLDMLDLSMLEEAMPDETAGNKEKENKVDEFGFDWSTSSAAVDLGASKPAPKPASDNEFIFDETPSAAAKADETSLDDLDLMAELNELSKETEDLEHNEFLMEAAEKPAAPVEKKPVATEPKPAKEEPSDFDLQTSEISTGNLDEFLTAAREEAHPDFDKVMLTEEDEVEFEPAGHFEATMVEEPARAVTEKSLAKEPAFEAPLDDDLDEPEFTTTQKNNLSKAPPPKEEKPAKRGGSGFAVFLGLLALTAAGGAGWQSFQNMQRLDQLEARINALPGVGKASGVDARQNQAIESVTTQAVNLQQRLDDLTGIVTELATKPASSRSKPAAASGGWVVNLTSVASEAAAEEELKRLKGLGIDAESARVEINGKPWYRIRVGGFADSAAAQAKRDELARKLGIKDGWIGRR